MSRMGEHAMEIGMPAQIGPRSLADALVDAQKEMQNPPLDGFNPHFKSKFSTLLAVRDTVVPILNKHGIFVTQIFGIKENVGSILITSLVKGVDRVESMVPVPQMPDIQKWAAAVTYIRRIALLSICGVVGDPDADAEDVVRQPDEVRSFKTSPHPEPEYKVDAEIAGQYADAIKAHINVNNPAGLYALHKELNTDVTMYSAVGALLNTKEKAALKDAVAGKGANAF